MFKPHPFLQQLPQERAQPQVVIELREEDNEKACVSGEFWRHYVLPWPVTSLKIKPGIWTSLEFCLVLTGCGQLDPLCRCSWILFPLDALPLANGRLPAPTRKYTDTYVCTHTSPHKVVGNNYCLPILFLYLLVGFYRSAEILSFHILDLVLSQDRAPALNIWSSPRSHWMTDLHLFLPLPGVIPSS